MCYEQKPPKAAYNYKQATLLSAFLWLRCTLYLMTNNTTHNCNPPSPRLTPVKVLVSVAYEPGRSPPSELQGFVDHLEQLGAEVVNFDSLLLFKLD